MITYKLCSIYYNPQTGTLTICYIQYHTHIIAVTESTPHITHIDLPYDPPDDLDCHPYILHLSVPQDIY